MKSFDLPRYIRTTLALSVGVGVISWGFIVIKDDRRLTTQPEPNPAECRLLPLKSYAITSTHTESDIHDIELSIRELIIASLYGHPEARDHLKKIRHARQKALVNVGELRERFQPAMEALDNCPNRDTYLTPEETANLNSVYDLLERGPYVLRHRAAELITTHFDSPRAIHAIETYILNYAADGELDFFSSWLGDLDTKFTLDALITIGRNERYPTLMRWAAVQGFRKLNADDLLDRAKIELDLYWEDLRQKPPENDLQWALLNEIENALHLYYGFRPHPQVIDPTTLAGVHLATAIVIGRARFHKTSPPPPTTVHAIADQLLQFITISPHEHERRLGIKALGRMASEQLDLRHITARLMHHIDAEVSTSNQGMALHVLSQIQTRPEFLQTLENLVMTPVSGRARVSAMKELALYLEFALEDPEWSLRRQIVEHLRVALPHEFERDADVYFHMSKAIQDYDKEIAHRGR